ncbi:hypothetical protein ELH01_08300 [Rhizobium ruizarguesonis]|uniref:hypothetical protein n=1 Tax=Rhizobium ruizarguesonis TaxID=2081791 RepID=UPI00102FBABA|nr:hypothetical protein [Rhizobium ruizarguesonis]TBE77244.1 hypothetical protein ELH01_08300 [Rhizobium ruizarguesonis]
MNCDQFIITRLAGGLWHTTSQRLFEAIMTDGFVRPEPSIPGSDRYGGGRSVSFVRLIGGFSVFDVPNDFDVEQYRNDFRASSIDEFMPYRRDWKRSIWIKIDPVACGNAVIGGSATLQRWRDEEAYSYRIMPEIEGAHVGDMPVSSILSVYSIGESDQDWRPVAP